jgi:hypothetical protein
MPSLILKTLFAVLGCLVAADIVGALACTLFDILDLRSNSPALSYAIWLVAGAFCGLIAYNIAGAWSSPKGRWGDWNSAPGSKRTGTVILIVSALVVVALAAAFYALYWSRGVAGDDYVPDSEPHSLVFFGAVLAGVAVGRFMLMSDPDKPA